MDDALSIQFVSVISKELDDFGVVVAMLQRETCYVRNFGVPTGFSMLQKSDVLLYFLTLFCLAYCFLFHNCLVSDYRASRETSNEPQLGQKAEVTLVV